MSHYTEAQRALHFPKAGGVIVTAMNSAREEWEHEGRVYWQFDDGSVLTMDDDSGDFDHYADIDAATALEAA
jgi:hypothetical protein